MTLFSHGETNMATLGQWWKAKVCSTSTQSWASLWLLFQNWRGLILSGTRSQSWNCTSCRALEITSLWGIHQSLWANCIKTHEQPVSPEHIATLHSVLGFSITVYSLQLLAHRLVGAHSAPCLNWANAQLPSLSQLQLGLTYYRFWGGD